VNLEPIELGPTGREFVGLLNRPASASSKPPCLLFNPYGQEAIRSAPLYRSLADRLQRAGHLVLRFDYRGTGNSPGDETSLTLADMVADGLRASDQLRRFGRQRQTWFGLSLGATVAIQAALAARAPPGRLILWQPVVDGPDYCRRMIEQHREELAHELQESWERLRARGFQEPAVPGHLLGFCVGRELAADLMALRPLSISSLLGKDTAVDYASDDPPTAGEYAAFGQRWRAVKVGSPINWLAGEAASTSLVPQEIMELVLSAKLQS
jgi:pimeloyl-ACP methyl ester carboxylesterase